MNIIKDSQEGGLAPALPIKTKISQSSSNHLLYILSPLHIYLDNSYKAEPVNSNWCLQDCCVIIA